MLWAVVIESVVFVLSDVAGSECCRPWLRRRLVRFDLELIANVG